MKAHTPLPEINRRTFLRSLSTTLFGSAALYLTAACGPPRSNDPPLPAVEATAAPQQLLPTPPVQSNDAQLQEFLALSRLLTGVQTLAPILGAVYLQSLRSTGENEGGIDILIEQSGLRSSSPPTSLEALETTGIFAQEETRALADKITELWYTGVYDVAEGEQQVATYVDALAWQTLRFTKPTTLCGAVGFWSEAPERALD